MKVDLTVSCEKSALDLGTGLAAFLGAVKKSVADGWNPLTDLPAIVLAAIADLVPVITEASQLPAEWAEDKEAFANSIMITGSKIIGAVTK